MRNLHAIRRPRAETSVSGRAGVRFAFAAALLAAALFAVACEKPDASFTTSPSVRALVGTTTGNSIVNPPGSAPAPAEPREGWAEDLGQASFTKLENGTPGLMVVLQMDSKPGAGMEVWLTKETGEPVVKWTGGATTDYAGTVCWQFSTQDKGAALPIDPNAKYHLTVGFIDPSTGPKVVRTIPVTGNTPHLQGAPPGPESEVFTKTYSCPRGS